MNLIFCQDGLNFGGKPSSLAVYDPATGDVDCPKDEEELKETLRRN